MRKRKVGLAVSGMAEEDKEEGEAGEREAHLG